MELDEEAVARPDHHTQAPEAEDNACNFAEAEDSLDHAPLVGLKADRVRRRLEELHAEDTEVCHLLLEACLRRALKGTRCGPVQTPEPETRRA